MLVFGLLSALFDYATFGILFFVLHSDVNQFRTAWFIESVISASMVVLVIRTRRPLIKSRPRMHLTLSTLFVVLHYDRFAFHAHCKLFWVKRDFCFVSVCNRNNCFDVYYYGRNSQKIFIKE